jgi:hypothetical protein
MTPSLQEEFFDVADAAVQARCQHSRSHHRGADDCDRTCLQRGSPRLVTFKYRIPRHSLLPGHIADPSTEPGWQVMEHQTVIDELVERAGSPDIPDLEAKLSPFREKFIDLKEHSIALFSIALGDTDDSFLRRKLKQIESIAVPDRHEIAHSFLPNQY